MVLFVESCPFRCPHAKVFTIVCEIESVSNSVLEVPIILERTVFVDTG